MTREELRTAWIAALRSGKYTQGRGELKSANNEYCCLGVLCEIAKAPCVYRYGSNWYDNSRIALSKAMCEDVGLFSRYGGRKDRKENVCLSDLNDSGYTFEQIADELETGEYWE